MAAVKLATKLLQDLSLRFSSSLRSLEIIEHSAQRLDIELSGSDDNTLGFSQGLPQTRGASGHRSRCEHCHHCCCFTLNCTRDQRPAPVESSWHRLSDDEQSGSCQSGHDSERSSSPALRCTADTSICDTREFGGGCDCNGCRQLCKLGRIPDRPARHWLGCSAAAERREVGIASYAGCPP